LLAVGASLVIRLPAGDPTEAVERPRQFAALRDLRFLGVVATCTVLATHVTVLMVVLPLWALNRTSVPHFFVPLMLVINTAFVILFQVRASKGAETVAGAARTGRYAGLWLAAGCLLASVTAVWQNLALTLIAIVAAVLALSMAEVTQAASAWGLAFGLAPSNAQGEYLGAFETHLTAQNIVGPAILSGLVISQGFWGWLAIAVVAVAGAVLVVPAARRSAAAMAGMPSSVGARVAEGDGDTFETQ
jgi:hypothetical protein